MLHLALKKARQSIAIITTLATFIISHNQVGELVPLVLGEYLPNKDFVAEGLCVQFAANMPLMVSAQVSFCCQGLYVFWEILNSNSLFDCTRMYMIRNKPLKHSDHMLYE